MSIDWPRLCRMLPAIRSSATRRTLPIILSGAAIPGPIAIIVNRARQAQTVEASRLKLTRFGCATQRLRTNRSKSEADTAAVLTIGRVAIT